MVKKLAIIIYLLSSLSTSIYAQEKAFYSESSANNYSGNTKSGDNNTMTMICPALSTYPIMPGYRIAGLSPTCLAVPVQWLELDEGAPLDQNKESQEYQFLYGQAGLNQFNQIELN